MRKTLLLLFVLFCFTVLAHAQGGLLNDSVLRADGQAAVGATVRVCTEAASGSPCSPTASIFTDKALTIAKTNPIAVDSAGAFTYYATPSFYKEEICLGASCVTRIVQIAEPPTFIIRADNQTGADGGLKIAACLTALPATGGTCDARGLEGAQVISATITIPADVQLLLGAATYTSSVFPVFRMNGESILQGIGGRGTTRIVANLTSGAMIRADDPVVGEEGIKIRDIFLDNTTPTNAGVIGIDFQGVIVSEVRDVRIDNVETGIRVGGNSFCACYNSFYNVQVVTVDTGVNFSTTANKNYWFGGTVQPFGTGGVGFLLGGASNSLFSPDIQNFSGGFGIDVTTAGHGIYDPYLETGGTGIRLGVNATTGSILGGGNFSSLTANFDIAALSTANLRTWNIQVRAAAGSIFYGPRVGAAQFTLTTQLGSSLQVSMNFDGAQGAGFEFEPGSGMSGKAPVNVKEVRLNDVGSGSTVDLKSSSSGNVSATFPPTTGTVAIIERVQTFTAAQTIPIVSPLEGATTNVPRWIFKQVDFSDMTAASTADLFTLWTLPANTIIHDVVGEVVTGWSGGSISAAVCSVGQAASNDLTLDDDFFAAATVYELHDATANGGKGIKLFDSTDKFAPWMFLAGGVIEIQCDLTGDNHANATAGQARIYALVSQPLGNTTVEAN